MYFLKRNSKPPFAPKIPPASLVRKAFRLILYFLLLTSSPSFAVAGLNLRSLSNVSTKNITTTPNTPQVFIVFQKDCPACYKQIKDLNCLKKFANIFLIGSFSNEADLRREYQKFNSNFPGFYGDTAFKQFFKINMNLTPQIIINTTHGYQLTLGGLSCSRIAQTLNSFLLKKPQLK